MVVIAAETAEIENTGLFPKILYFPISMKRERYYHMEESQSHSNKKEQIIYRTFIFSLVMHF